MTVVIPTHNRDTLLKQTLQGFCGLIDTPHSWELVIVDDGSTDATQMTVAEYANRLPMRYLYQPKSGVACARNLGLNNARSPLVLFLDDDVIPGPLLLAEHLRFHQEHRGTEAALLGYVTWFPDLPITPFMRWYGEFGALFGYSLLKDGERANLRYLYSCNISFKTDFLRKQGQFNERLSVLEDNELGFRLGQKGLEMYFKRGALGFHNQTFTFEQSCKRLERYSAGLDAFLATPAGTALMSRRNRFLFRTANRLVKLIGPILIPFKPMLDADTKLPNAIYRLFYWYFGSHLSFWSRVKSVRPLDEKAK